jgi:predicted ABC-type ATPase
MELVTAVPRPDVIVLGGPNGAGKSTAAPRLLRGVLAVDEFVNADTLAQGLSAFRPEGVAVEAGRITLARLDALARQRRSFAFESTLAGQSLARRLTALNAHGHTVHVPYLWLRDIELAIARVAERVRAGGHDVPVKAVRRRYERGRRNFFMLYRGVSEPVARLRRIAGPWAATGRNRWRGRGNTRPAAAGLADSLGRIRPMSDTEPTITELFDEGTAIDQALRDAARDARRFHKAIGNPMATWEDGKVVWVQPEDIVVDAPAETNDDCDRP